MSDGIELTPEQTQALADLTRDGRRVLIRQLSAADTHPAADIYVTPTGTSNGKRITPTGEVHDIGETLPAD